MASRRVEHYVFDTNETPQSKCRFGGTYLGRDTRHDREVAINVIPITRLRSDFNSETFQAKVKYLKSIRGPNAVQLYDIIVSPQSGHIYVITEAFHRRSLYYLQKETPVIPEQHALRLLRHIACALRLNRDLTLKNSGYEYSRLIHNHKHLAPNHIFIQGGRVKIADTGLYTLLEDVFEASEFPEPINISCYEAPEVHYKQTDQTVQDASDVWTLGVLIYDALYGVGPFKGKTPEERYEHLERRGLRFPDDVLVSVETKELLTRMLTINHRSRISLYEVLGHPAMNDALVLRREGERRSIKDSEETTLISILENTFNEVEDTQIYLNPHSKPSHERVNNKPYYYEEYEPTQEPEEQRATGPEQVQVHHNNHQQQVAGNEQANANAQTDAEKEAREREEREREERKRNKKSACNCNIF